MSDLQGWPDVLVTRNTDTTCFLTNKHTSTYHPASSWGEQPSSSFKAAIALALNLHKGQIKNTYFLISRFSEKIVQRIKNCQIGLSGHSGGSLIIFQTSYLPLYFISPLSYYRFDGHKWALVWLTGSQTAWLWHSDQVSTVNTGRIWLQWWLLGSSAVMV